MKAMNSLPSFFAHPFAKMRGAEQDDIPALVKIINEAYSYQDEAKGAKRTNPEHLYKRMTETDFYVIEADGNIIGCVYTESCENSLHFGLLTLIPTMRKQGIAESAMKAIESTARHNNYKAIELDYMSLAPWLKSYYEKYGYKETGEITPWDKIDLIRMKKVLN